MTKKITNTEQVPKLLVSILLGFVFSYTLNFATVFASSSALFSKAPVAIPFFSLVAAVIIYATLGIVNLAREKDSHLRPLMISSSIGVTLVILLGIMIKTFQLGGSDFNELVILSLISLLIIHTIVLIVAYLLLLKLSKYEENIKNLFALFGFYIGSFGASFVVYLMVFMISFLGSWN